MISSMEATEWACWVRPIAQHGLTVRLDRAIMSATRSNCSRPIPAASHTVSRFTSHQVGGVLVETVAVRGDEVRSIR